LNLKIQIDGYTGCRVMITAVHSFQHQAGAAERIWKRKRLERGLDSQVSYGQRFVVMFLYAGSDCCIGLVLYL